MNELRTRIGGARATLGRLRRRVVALAHRATSSPLVHSPAATVKAETVFCPCCRTPHAAYEPVWYTTSGICPSCRSYHRHRLLMLYLERETDLLRGGEPIRLLHCAPERCLADHLTGNARIRYFSTDRCADGYDYTDMGLSVRSNIVALPFRDASFDVILCNHVFEHVEDDRAAMREVLRVLAQTGWAVLMVPLDRKATTHEDPTITDPDERARVFGQLDHVRLYGLDYGARLEEIGFRVEMIDYASRFDAAETRSFGLLQGVDDTIVVCRREVD